MAWSPATARRRRSGYYILHEGPLGVFNGTLHEHKYKDIKEDSNIEYKSTGGWMGITDKYWLVSLVPDQKAPVDPRITPYQHQGQDRYQVDYTGEPTHGGARRQRRDDQPPVRRRQGGQAARRLSPSSYSIKNFDLAIDWGWFWFLTKPIFWLLDFLTSWSAISASPILVLTVIVKLVFFPLANKSYEAMSKMKALQPEMEKLKSATATTARA